MTLFSHSHIKLHHLHTNLHLPNQISEYFYTLHDIIIFRVHPTTRAALYYPHQPPQPQPINLGGRDTPTPRIDALENGIMIYSIVDGRIQGAYGLKPPRNTI